MTQVWQRLSQLISPDWLGQLQHVDAEVTVGVAAEADPNIRAIALAQRRSALLACIFGVPTLLCLWIYTLAYRRDNLLMLYMPLLLAAIIVGVTLQQLSTRPRTSQAAYVLIWSTLIYSLACLGYRAIFPAQFDQGMQLLVALVVVMAGVAVCLRFRPLQAGLTLALLTLLHSLPLLSGFIHHALSARVGLMGVVTELMLSAVLALIYSSTWTQVALGRSEASNMQFAHLSRTDHLTGLCNRRSLYGSIEKLMAEMNERQGGQAAETQRSSDQGSETLGDGLGDLITGDRLTTFVVALLDVDHFKAVNDSFGHASGDTVLCGVAEVLQSFMRQRDLAGRWGGEEFVLVLPGVSLEQGAQVAERLRSRIESARMLPGRSVTASFGVTAWRQGDTLEALMARADAAMYQAKRGGRNRVELSTPPQESGPVLTNPAVTNPVQSGPAQYVPEVPAPGAEGAASAQSGVALLSVSGLIETDT
jgi:diguanylate cyclase (GGDEF)-like protein